MRLVAVAMVLALTACGGGSDGDSENGTVSVLLPAPSDLSVVSGVRSITITWNPVPSATGYTIYLATQSGVNRTNYAALPGGQKVESPTSSLTQAGLTGGTTYYFVVTATNAAGEGPESTEVSAMAMEENSWSTMGGNVRHTGYNAAETGHPPLTQAWSIALTASPLDPAVIENGRVFVTSSPGTSLWALSTADGSFLWSGGSNASHASVRQGRVYGFKVEAGGLTGIFWCDDASTGSNRWWSQFLSPWGKSWAPIAVDGQVYLGTRLGLYSFNETDGAQLFFSSLPERYDQWTPAYHAGTLYSFVAGHLRAYDPTTGAIQWTVTMPWNPIELSMTTAPVVGEPLVYVVAPPVLYAIHPTSQAVAWSAGGFNFKGTPAYAAGMVYAISGTALQAHAWTTGAFLWSFSGDNALKYPPVIAGGYVYVSSDNNVYAINLTTQAQAWTAPVGGWLSIAEGKLFVAGPTGVLRAYALTP